MTTLDPREALARAISDEVHVDPAHGFPAGFDAADLAANVLAALNDAGYTIGARDEPGPVLREALERLSDNAVIPTEYEDYYLVRRSDYALLKAVLDASLVAR